MLSNTLTMKAIRLIALLLFLPMTFYAQTLTGLWTGTLTNDSNTIRKNQELEIVLTQYKDKVYGFSRMTFIVHDTLYYIVKRVKGTIENDVCEVVDDEIVTHNFPRKPDKGVKLVSTFRRNQQDSAWQLDGDWKTTESRKHRYYSISGKLSLRSEPDLDKAKIFPHLEELKMTSDIAFYQESKKAEESAVAAKLAAKNAENRDLAVEKKTQPLPINQSSSSQVVNTRVNPVATIKAPVMSPPQEKVEERSVAATTLEKPVTEPLATTEVAKNDVTKNRPVPPAATYSPTNRPAKADTSVAKTKKEVTREQSPATTAVTKPKAEEKKMVTKDIPASTIAAKDPAIETKGEMKKSPETVAAETMITETARVATVPNKEIIPAQKPAETVPSAVAPARIAERSVAAPQTVFFKSDSLELSLYDNGEVDGDTVSVLLNGQLILEKQGLKTSAIKKTIYVPAGQADSLTLVLFAENLGKYPPNTGLLVVHDGEDVYQVRFSADLRQNAAVIFKRKRN
jgi:hypothetical protein